MKGVYRMSVKKRWICLFVENEVGVLARISGLFSSKSYNIDTITVGVTEDETISRMTIGFTSDDRTFEQVKKQLNRSVEVIKVVDYTDIAIHNNEILYVKVNSRSNEDKDEVFELQMHLATRSLTTIRNQCLLSVFRLMQRTTMQ